jgi:hypothetical protein
VWCPDWFQGTSLVSSLDCLPDWFLGTSLDTTPDRVLTQVWVASLQSDAGVGGSNPCWCDAVCDLVATKRSTLAWHFSGTPSVQCWSTRSLLPCQGKSTLSLKESSSPWHSNMSQRNCEYPIESGLKRISSPQDAAPFRFSFPTLSTYCNSTIKI